MTSPSGLWTEGDTLSPTNLNRRSPVGTFPAKTYHVAWATGTGTTQINNAITNALAGGYTAVFVDASRLPYDASAVTFNTAIHMFREGGSLSHSDYEPEAYGAVLDGTTDGWAAVTACAAGAFANRGTIRPGAGTLYLSRPWVEQHDLQLVGLPVRGGFATAPFSLKCAGGPALVINHTNTFGLLSTALVGTGNCFGDGTSSSRFLDLRDSPFAEFNGKSTFCYEFFFKTTALSANYHLASSFGTDFALVGQSCFRILLLAGGSLQAKLNVGGSVKTISGGTISANTTYWVALTYDGANVRLFYGQPGGTSILVGTAAATGTITQDPTEIVVPFGADPASAFTALPGYWDSIRVTWNTARYTATGTVPNNKLTVDANTVILLNADAQDGILTKGTGAFAPTEWWFWLRYQTDFGSRAHIENVNFSGGASGLLMVAGQGSMLRNLSFSGCRDALVIGYSDWGITIDNPYINQVTRYGIYINTLAGVLTLINPILANGCGRFGITIVDASVTIVAGYVVSGANTVCHLDLQGDAPVSTSGLALSTETPSALQQAIIRANSSGLEYVGGRIESSGTAPWIIVGGAGVHGVTFAGTTFRTDLGGAPTIMKIQSASNLPRRPVRLDGANQILGNWFPWSDTTGTAVLGHIGPRFSSSTGGTLSFDASIADEWDLTLSSDVTQSSWTRISYGQPVSGAIKMDSTGSRLFTWPTNSKGTATLSYGSAAINTFTGFYDGVNVILTSVRTGL